MVPKKRYCTPLLLATSHPSLCSLMLRLNAVKVFENFHIRTKSARSNMLQIPLHFLGSMTNKQYLKLRRSFHGSSNRGTYKQPRATHLPFATGRRFAETITFSVKNLYDKVIHDAQSYFLATRCTTFIASHRTLQ